MRLMAVKLYSLFAQKTQRVSTVLESSCFGTQHTVEWWWRWICHWKEYPHWWSPTDHDLATLFWTSNRVVVRWWMRVPKCRDHTDLNRYAVNNGAFYRKQSVIKRRLSRRSPVWREGPKHPKKCSWANRDEYVHLETKQGMKCLLWYHVEIWV